MTSEGKAEANRRNALKSTGPKTPEGKSAVRLNAVRHGLLSKEVRLPGEDEEALRELGERLGAEGQRGGGGGGRGARAESARGWRSEGGRAPRGRAAAGGGAREPFGRSSRRCGVEAAAPEPG